MMYSFENLNLALSTCFLLDTEQLTVSQALLISCQPNGFEGKKTAAKRMIMAYQCSQDSYNLQEIN